MARGNLAKNVKYGRIKKGPKRGGKAPAATRRGATIDRGPGINSLRRAAKKAITKGSKK
jgi:hypothetical protein|tara:strand:+ start:367 stop:543 length:177 start_codon:yes stop_codon:yes gene_type:complete